MVPFGGIFSSTVYSDKPMEGLPTEAESKFINVYMLPDPENEYDPLTIGIYCCSNKKMIGYMLNSDAHLLTTLITLLHLPSLDTAAIINQSHAVSNNYASPIYVEFFVDPWGRDAVLAELALDPYPNLNLLSKLGLRPSTPLMWKPDGL